MKLWNMELVSYEQIFGFVYICITWFLEHLIQLHSKCHLFCINDQMTVHYPLKYNFNNVQLGEALYKLGAHLGIILLFCVH